MFKKKYLSAVSLALCFSSVQVAAQTSISTPILSGPDNFRDIAGISPRFGGTGYANTTYYDGVMRTGVFYRTNAFISALNDSSSLTANGREILASLNIAHVIDLRTTVEIASKPEQPNVPIGATYTNVDIMGGSVATLPTLTISTPVNTINYMQITNRMFVSDAGQREKISEVLLQLAHNPGVTVYNCTSGKDRTGFISATLQLIAGVDPETVMQDYLATNVYTAERIEATLAHVAATYGQSVADAYVPIIGVQSSFLQSSFDEIAQLYGSSAISTPSTVNPTSDSFSSMSAPTLNVNYQAFTNYLIQGLGLTQADIYVLRAKMVAYQSLPGQAEMSANAKEGADFLLALQSSPLSGTYTDYNYFLQSAIDAGTLGGVENRVGGQLHADSQAYLLRNALRIDDAITTHINGVDLEVGQTTLWQANFANDARNDGRSGVERSNNHHVGLMLGVTHRASQQMSVNGGVGYNWAMVESNDDSGKANVDTALLTVGGRVALSDLDRGAYTRMQFSLGRVNYTSSRFIGNGLGTANGSSNGMVYDGLIDLGYIIKTEVASITPRIGARFSEAKLDGFNENGSELALQVDDLHDRNTTLSAGVELKLAEQKLSSFGITPVVDLSYEHANKSAVTSNASLYGVNISQESAADNKNLFRGNIGVAVKNKALSLELGMGKAYANNYSEVNGKAVLSYKF